MVLLGATVHDSREDLARIPAADPAARRSARRAAGRWADRSAAARGPADLHRWRRDSLALWRWLLGGDDASPTTTAPTPEVAEATSNWPI